MLFHTLVLKIENRIIARVALVFFIIFGVNPTSAWGVENHQAPQPLCKNVFLNPLSLFMAPRPETIEAITKDLKRIKAEQVINKTYDTAIEILKSMGVRLYFGKKVTYIGFVVGGLTQRFGDGSTTMSISTEGFTKAEIVSSLLHESRHFLKNDHYADGIATANDIGFAPVDPKKEQVYSSFQLDELPAYADELRFGVNIRILSDIQRGDLEGSTKTLLDFKGRNAWYGRFINAITEKAQVLKEGIFDQTKIYRVVVYKDRMGYVAVKTDGTEPGFFEISVEKGLSEVGAIARAKQLATDDTDLLIQKAREDYSYIDERLRGLAKVIDKMKKKALLAANSAQKK